MDEHPEHDSAPSTPPVRRDTGDAGDDEREARRQREQALRQLAARQQASEQLGSEAPARPSLAPPRRRGRVSRQRALLLVIVAVLLVGGISGGIFAAVQHTHSSTTGGTHPVPILRTQTVALDARLGLTCTSQPAWSPDGRFIALLAATTSAQGVQQCPPYLAVDPVTAVDNFTMPTPPLRIVILDARAQGIIRQLPLAPFLASEPNCPPKGVCQPTDPRLDSFYGLSWSPDGQSLAVLYVDTYVQPLSPIGCVPPANFGLLSLLVVRADGSSSFRLTDPCLLALGVPAAGLRLWDLHARRLVSSSAPSSLYPFTLPFAARYQWTTQGQLQAQGAPSGAPQGPVGSPQGRASFSPWQPGYLVRLSGPDGDNYMLRAAFWAWSPDSRFVATFGVVGGQVNVPGRIQAPTSTATTLPIAPLPPSGPALAAVVSALAAAPLLGVRMSPSDSVINQLPNPSAVEWAPNIAAYAALAWSHDGTRLAALICSGPTVGAVRVFATASGKLLGTSALAFPGTTGAADCGTDLGAIEWSLGDTAILITNASQPVFTLVAAPR